MCVCVSVCELYFKVIVLVMYCCFVSQSSLLGKTVSVSIVTICSTALSVGLHVLYALFEYVSCVHVCRLYVHASACVGLWNVSPAQL